MATMVEQSAAQGLTLTMTRVIRAPRERVFSAWLRPETIRLWFGPEHRAVADVQVDDRVGGRYEITMSPAHANARCTTDLDPGEKVAVRGEYKEISPYDRLSFTWIGDWNPAEESLVTITLREVEGGTEMRLEHTRFGSEASRAGHENGWMQGLDKLVKLLEG